jgi:hypothetical protein
MVGSAYTDENQKQESASFLKKRSKKLLTWGHGI